MGETISFGAEHDAIIKRLNALYREATCNRIVQTIPTFKDDCYAIMTGVKRLTKEELDYIRQRVVAIEAITAEGYNNNLVIEVKTEPTPTPNDKEEEK